MKKQPAYSGCFLFISVVDIITRVHAFIDDSIDLDCTVLRIIAKSNTLFTVIADLCRIKIAQIAFSAFDAFTIIEYAAGSFHDISPIP